MALTPSAEAIQAMSAVELTGAIRARTVSAREALDAQFEQISAVNSHINAVVTLDPEGAYALATAADERTAGTSTGTSTGDGLPPLHGLPMTHKDTHNTRGCAPPRGPSCSGILCPTPMT
ncbi:Asp-tRNA(Asn)/Glu-tRNA(Gln) amidotransferase A subunit family amidase [Arthrobacter sp. UYP6]